MPKTTIDIDPSVLRELKRRQRREGKTLDRLVSDLLRAAMRRDEATPPAPFEWITRPMKAR